MPTRIIDGATPRHSAPTPSVRATVADRENVRGGRGDANIRARAKLSTGAHPLAVAVAARASPAAPTALSGKWQRVPRCEAAHLWPPQSCLAALHTPGCEQPARSQPARSSWRRPTAEGSPPPPSQPHLRRTQCALSESHNRLSIAIHGSPLTRPTKGGVPPAADCTAVRLPRPAARLVATLPLPPLPRLSRSLLDHPAAGQPAQRARGRAGGARASARGRSNKAALFLGAVGAQVGAATPSDPSSPSAYETRTCGAPCGMPHAEAAHIAAQRAPQRRRTPQVLESPWVPSHAPWLRPTRPPPTQGCLPEKERVNACHFTPGPGRQPPPAHAHARTHPGSLIAGLLAMQRRTRAATPPAPRGRERE